MEGAEVDTSPESVDFVNSAAQKGIIHLIYNTSMI